MAAYPTGAILGDSPRIAALRAEIARLAACDGVGNPHVPTVLLRGETGTGKGLVARAMHDSGPRGRGPFIDVNCAAIPEAMLEAELFGFEAGAFTDAKRQKPGLFESASAGTLFLDEIDSLSRPVQSKVLKAIEEKRVRRLGSVVARDVDVKLIAATQRDLKAAVETGEFRADLYHRLAVLLLDIPPLRERGADVVRLGEHFLRAYADAHGLTPRRLNERARAWLGGYDWPGNVRELGHLMERVTLLTTTEEVDAESLAALCGSPGRVAPPAPTPPPVAEPRDADAEEGTRIRAALTKSGGNVVRAARLLGIGRNALRYRMRRHGIERPEVEQLDDIIASATRVTTLERARSLTTPEDETPTWEQKPAVVLAVSLAIPESGEDRGHDPWTEATRWARVVAEKVEGFGGVFAERSSSRFIAVFGVPRAVEQAAQRAIQAAVAIQRAAAAADLHPDLRIAVHAGDIRIDTNAAEPLSRLFPVGDAFALAERLLGHAGIDEVLLSPLVARRVERFFELRPRALQLGGSDRDRLTAHTVARQLSVPDSTLAASAGAFFGREREIGLLLDAFSRARDGGGQVVFVSGDAGIGKSRLLMEFRRRLAAGSYRWIEGRCASYGTTTPFLPLLDAFRRDLGIDDQDDEASAAIKLEREIELLGPEVRWTLPFLRQLLSFDVVDESVRALDAASRRSELFRAMRALTLRVAEMQPLIVVVEDLHWIDPASEEYVGFLSEVVPTARVLLLLSHRTGYVVPFPNRSYHLNVALPPLTGSDMAAMTGSVLGSEEIPGALRLLIANKAEGNPFFVEELSRSLLEEGALRREEGRILLARDLDEISVPDTIQDVLIARIDRLEEESRRAIQMASVIGREFALRLLARITDAGERIQSQVEELRSLELIYEKALHPELAYMFKHALTHDVAYESVVLERRKSLHRIIGSVIEELYADRLPEHYETLAHHYGRGEDWEKALRYHERSAEKAAETHANRAVVEHCRAGLAIIDRLGERDTGDARCRLNERIGRACFYLSEYVASASAYEEAAAVSRDPEKRALFLGLGAYSAFYGHRYQAAKRDIDNALVFSRSQRIEAGEALALVARGFYRGVHDHDLDGCEHDQQDALAICARHPNEAVEGLATVHLAMIAEWSGDFETARRRAEGAIAIGRKLRMPEILIWSSWFLAKALCCTGEYARAIALLDEAHDLCDRVGDRAWKTRMLNTLGWCFAEIGAVERARRHNEKAAALAREIGDPEILANADVNLAMNHLQLGQLDRALAYLEPIEAAAAQSSDPWMRWRYVMHLRHARGLLELARGEPSKAMAAADEELARARQYRSPKLEARAQSLRAATFLRLEDRAAAMDSLQQALEISGRIGYRRGIWRAHRLLGEALRRDGDRMAAEEHAARALAAAAQAAALLRDDELRRHLLASAAAEDEP